MSPEQARGRPLDKRTDIWSFGCVLFEAITGQQAYKGDTISDSIAAILKSEPDWKAIPETTPIKIRDLLQRCLQKDPHNRLHDIADARIDIRDVLTGPPAEVVTTARPAPKCRTLFWATVGLALVLSCVLLWSPWRTVPLPDQRFRRLTIITKPLYGTGLGSSILAASPDGTRIVYVAAGDKTNQLYLREIDQFTAEQIPGTQGAQSPFFSPDNQWIGFFSEDKLKKVSLTGGKPTILCDAPTHTGRTWTFDDTIIFGVMGEGLKRVSAAGGKPEAITNVDFENGEWIHTDPELLLGGETLLFTALDGNCNALYIVAQNVKTSKKHILIRGGNSPHYLQTEHLTYVQEGSMLAVPFDLEKLQITGPSVTVIDDIMMGRCTGTDISISKDGSIFYMPGRYRMERLLVWVDRQGNSEPITEERRIFSGPRFSPDGERLAMWIGEEGDSQVWVYDIIRGILRRLTSEGQNFWPSWTPDGKRIAFPSIQPPGKGGFGMFWKLADGSGPAERLTESQYTQQPLSWTPNGKSLIFHQSFHPKTGWDIFVLPMEEDRKPFPLLDSPSNEKWPALSPDGRWLAYVSDESGRMEVYVTTFPDPGGRKQISNQGGVEPAWARSGRELFYRNGDKMMAVDIVTEPEFRPTKPRLLFEGNYRDVPYGRMYDITPDGKRFVMVQEIEQDSAATQINVVLNWFEELKRLVPTGKK